MAERPKSGGFEASKPSFRDLQRSAESGFVEKAIARYLIPKNTDKSIRRHERLGTPLARKVVLDTVGRVYSRPGKGGIYKLDYRKGGMDAAANLVFRGSVFNEAVHTVAAALLTETPIVDIAEGRYSPGLGVNAILVGVNLALVAVQRYNRARTIKFIDRQLRRGRSFSPSYRNWVGIDARALRNYQAKKQQK